MMTILITIIITALTIIINRIMALNIVTIVDIHVIQDANAQQGTIIVIFVAFQDIGQMFA